MDELIWLLSKYNLKDARRIEESDRQFFAIKKICENIWNSPFFFAIIIANSLLSYQLSSTGEEYWEEFAEFSIRYEFPEEYDFKATFSFFETFLLQSKWNKRILNMKMPRLIKTEALFDIIKGEEEYFYNNLSELQVALSKTMKQDKESKTILFALKMFHYAARIKFWYFLISPYGIGIPIDSRIARIWDKYNTEWMKIQEFWEEVSQKIQIPRLHLDAILWTRCDDFICF
ncbi:MAG: hypothetical protein ACD_3C00196G0025 [uncultured bacterium (gcode 4)]|uniref:N-glycosylase/DNA lyase n=1 Tax=uncultured bacterium (gcode 4) TaxID=1234023 RepID=K2G054_9BACT|nr:MAG: hypothetical protein ACD_3C00196G0025 [uncultured bacterium (gcode 4)]